MINEKLIIEQAKKMAAFMNICVDDFCWRDHYSLAICDSDGHINLMECDFYTPHNNWNQLMDVVEKIESIQNSDDYEVDIFGKCCDIGGRFEGTGETKKKAVVSAIIAFIDWYNTK